jgi:hypothetical protein
MCAGVVESQKQLATRVDHGHTCMDECLSLGSQKRQGTRLKTRKIHLEIADLKQKEHKITYKDKESYFQGQQ